MQPMKSLLCLTAIIAGLSMPLASAAIAGDSTVQQIQTLLTRLGYAPGPADGILGKGTRQALDNFLTKEYLSLDGASPGERNAEALVDLNRKWDEAKPDRKLVLDVQSLLGKLGYVPIHSSGTYDAVTQKTLWLYAIVGGKSDLFQDHTKTIAARLAEFRILLKASLEKRDTMSANDLIALDTQQADIMPRLATNISGNIAVSIDSSAIKVWNAKTGAQVRTIPIPALAASSFFGPMALSADGRHVAVGKEVVAVYDTKTGKMERMFLLPSDGYLSKLTFRPNHDELVFDQNNALYVINWRTADRVIKLGEHTNPRYLDGNMWRWVRWSGIHDFAVSPSGRLAASVGTDFGVRIWNLDTGHMEHFYHGPRGLQYRNVAFSGDERFVMATADGSSQLHKRSTSLFTRFKLTSGATKSHVIASDYMRGFVVSANRRKIYLEYAQKKNDFKLITKGKKLTFDDDTKDDTHDVSTGDIGRRVTDKSFDAIAGDRILNMDVSSGRLEVMNLDGSSVIDKPTKVLDLVQAGRFVSGATGHTDLSNDANNIIALESSMSVPAKIRAVGEHFSVSRFFPPFTVGDNYAFVGVPYKKGSSGFEFPDLSAPPGVLITDRSAKPVCQVGDVIETEKKNIARVNSGSLSVSNALHLVATRTFAGFHLIDAATCKVIRTVPVSSVTHFQFKRLKIGTRFAITSGLEVSGNGKTLLAWTDEPAVQGFDLATGRPTKVWSTDLRKLPLPDGLKIARKNATKVPGITAVWSVTAIPGTRRFIVALRGTTQMGDRYGLGYMMLFDESQTEPLRVLQVPQLEYDIRPVFADRGRLMAVARASGSTQTVSLEDGRVVATLHIEGKARSLAFSPDGKRVIVATGQGLFETFDARTGKLLATTAAFKGGEWVRITPEGFFDSSKKGADALHVARGYDVYSIDQVYQALYRPDLVAAKLAGDPDGKVKAAAAKLDLEKVIDSGAAPKVAITDPKAGASVDAETVSVHAAITDEGGGVGKVEWRVNGITLGIDSRGFDRLATAGGGVSGSDGSGSGSSEEGGGRTMTVERTLSLDPGDNHIEVIAYNAKGLIASEPAGLDVKWAGATASTPPKLYVLAVGINDYWDSRLKLTYAAPDAKAVASALRKSGKGLYEAVDVTTVLDGAATTANLGKAFDKLSAQVRPRDVFVLFMAGHGKTEDGHYYFLPQDFRYVDASSVAKGGIDQDTFQLWLSKIKARKSVLLYDTCDSGSLTHAGVASRGLERVAALARMTRAMGRTVLSASTDDTPALEGYRGHGVFTYALLSALGKADENRDGMIEVTELAGAIDKQVPAISYAAFKFRQVPQMSIVGSDFPLTDQVAVLTPGANATPAPATQSAAQRPSGKAPAGTAPKPTHVVIAMAKVHQIADPDSPVVTQLTPGTQVRLVKSADGWTLVARNGKQLGYIPANELAQMQ